MKTIIMTAAVAAAAFFWSGCLVQTGLSDPPEQKSEKEMVSFSFRAAANEAIGYTASAEISGNSITVTVPSGTDVTSLAPLFSFRGAAVEVEGLAQESGITFNDFTDPVVYTVFAEDGSSMEYTVTVIVASADPDTSREMTEFSFYAANNAGLSEDAAGIITGAGISAVLPAGTDLTALTATFDITGERTDVDGVVQESGVTENDFSYPLIYSVIAEDGNSREYTVTILVAPESLDTSKSIIVFGFEADKNSKLSEEIMGVLEGTEIRALLPSDADLSGLTATFNITGGTVKVGDVIQESGVTENDFTNSVIYTVTAEDGSSVEYTVIITLESEQVDNSREVTTFSFSAADNEGLSEDVAGIINGTGISAVLPAGTDLTTLIATFTITGERAEADGVVQESGISANDFTNPVVYTVFAEDGSSEEYTVATSLASADMDTTKEIIAFSFSAADNPGLPVDLAADISGASISAVLPAEADPAGLIADFEFAGERVEVGGSIQESGASVNDFSVPVIYLVFAQDGAAREYTVTVARESRDTLKAIIAFGFEAERNASLSVDVLGEISGSDINVVLPYGSGLNDLTATFNITGGTVKTGDEIQESGISQNDFSSPVIYTVTAEDGSSREYAVIVTVAPDTVVPDTSKAITGFSFTTAGNSQLVSDITGTISGTSIQSTVPFGTDISMLVADFSTSGIYVMAGSTVQESGVTANDFTDVVIYSVEAEDGSTRDYQVTVSATPDTSRQLTAFSFSAADNVQLQADAAGDINGTSVTATVPTGTDVTSLVAAFSTTGRAVLIDGSAQTSGVTANDFSGTVTYTVEAEDGSTRDYRVTVTVEPGDFEITGTWSSSSPVYTMIITGGTLTLERVADTAYAQITSMSEADTRCLLNWTVNPDANQPFQKMQWLVLGPDTMVVRWYEYKPQPSAAESNENVIATQTVTRQ
ncbi:hypothetical protein ACFL5V_01910 [Fibrobacterota bacterium]